MSQNFCIGDRVLLIGRRECRGTVNAIKAYPRNGCIGPYIDIDVMWDFDSRLSWTLSDALRHMTILEELAECADD